MHLYNSSSVFRLLLEQVRAEVRVPPLPGVQSQGLLLPIQGGELQAAIQLRLRGRKLRVSPGNVTNIQNNPSSETFLSRNNSSTTITTTTTAPLRRTDLLLHIIIPNLTVATSLLHLRRPLPLLRQSRQSRKRSATFTRHWIPRPRQKCLTTSTSRWGSNLTEN